MLRDRDKPYENLENTGITRAYANLLCLLRACSWRVVYAVFGFLALPLVRCRFGTPFPMPSLRPLTGCWTLLAFPVQEEQLLTRRCLCLAVSLLSRRVEAMEKSLKRDLMREAAQGGGRVLLHDEVRSLVSISLFSVLASGAAIEPVSLALARLPVLRAVNLRVGLAV